MTNLDKLAPTSRVWVYQSSRAFSESESETIAQLAQKFAHSWAAHGRELVAAGSLLHHRFLVLAVDEQLAGASGCSIDTSVGFVRELQSTYAVDFLDRMQFAFRDERGEVRTATRAAFAQLYAAGVIDDDTLVFDTLVATLADLQNRFEVPLGQSWHKRMVGIAV